MLFLVVCYFLEFGANRKNNGRVKTGYVTNKVIGVDGGMFAQ